MQHHILNTTLQHMMQHNATAYQHIFFSSIFTQNFSLRSFTTLCSKECHPSTASFLRFLLFHFLLPSSSIFFSISFKKNTHHQNAPRYRGYTSNTSQHTAHHHTSHHCHIPFHQTTHLLWAHTSKWHPLGFPASASLLADLLCCRTFFVITAAMEVETPPNSTDVLVSYTSIL